jgi:hypothetical protein
MRPDFATLDETEWCECILERLPEIDVPVTRAGLGVPTVTR